MLVIRFARFGKKNSPFFRMVVMDKRKTPTGRAIETVGSLDPFKKTLILKNERILHWISVGAQPSDRVYNLLIEKKVIEGKKRVKKMKLKKNEEEKTEAPVASAPASTNKEVEKTETNTEKPVIDTGVAETAEIEQPATDTTTTETIETPEPIIEEVKQPEEQEEITKADIVADTAKIDTAKGEKAPKIKENK